MRVGGQGGGWDEAEMGEGGESDGAIREHFTWLCAFGSFALFSVWWSWMSGFPPAEAQSSHLYGGNYSTECPKDLGAG